MEIRCHCTACGAVFRVRDEFAGKRIKCAKCRAVIGVPPLPPATKLPPGAPPAQEEVLAGLVGLNSMGSPRAATAVGSKRARIGKKSRGWQGWHIAIAVGGVAAGACLVGTMAWLASNNSTTPQPSSASPRTVASAELGVLVLEIPESERAGASLLIDDEKKEVPARGPLEYRLAAGEHRVKVVCGGRHADRRLSLKAGEKYSYQPAWSDDDALAAAISGNALEPSAKDWLSGADADKNEPPRGQPQEFRGFPGVPPGTPPGNFRGNAGPNNARPPRGHMPPDDPAATPPHVRKNVSNPSLPSLDGVIWADQPANFRDLRGKTVILLVYDYSDSEISRWSDEFLDQLKAAIHDKPVVVLAIDVGKTTADVGPAYLGKQHFNMPNVILGRDGLMATRLGFKDVMFDYAWIDPEGRMKHKGNGLISYEEGGRREFDLPAALGECVDLGKFEVVDAAMSDKVKKLLWPFELGRLPAEKALKAAQQTHGPGERRGRQGRRAFPGRPVGADSPNFPRARGAIGSWPVTRPTVWLRPIRPGTRASRPRNCRPNSSAIRTSPASWLHGAPTTRSCCR